VCGALLYKSVLVLLSFSHLILTIASPSHNSRREPEPQDRAKPHQHTRTEISTQTSDERATESYFSDYKRRRYDNHHLDPESKVRM
jgi:hypothetical protein